uniref:Glycerophosphodiester phosphodiesterase domain containing 3a n=1 Tax=Hucho hucho TaxID=62062 RepID=A0A4W5PE84_9TELE
MASYLYFILPALGGYTLTSLYLLKNPQILHKKKRAAFHCTHISHRGGSGERIESTMEAFTHAVEQGTGMLELDCHLTLDGHVVVSHDENLLRQTGHDVTISSLNLEVRDQIQMLLVRFRNQCRYSTGTDRKFTLLEDVFRKFPKMPVNIEIKEDNETFFLHSLNPPSLPWSSCSLLSRSSISPLTSPLSALPLSLRGLQLLLLYYSGLLPFVPLGESFLQFYLPRIINRCVCVCVCIYMCHVCFFAYGFQSSCVHLFVCNEDPDIEAAFEAGATGVMTDYPTLLTDYLHRHRTYERGIYSTTV